MRVIASGFGLVESPRWHHGRLWFSDWTAGEIHVLDDDGSSRVKVRHESLPLCFDFQPDGTMLVVSSAQRTLLRLTSDGDLVEHASLEPLSSAGANDIVVDGRGNAYVNSHDAPMGTMAAAGERATGRVYLVPSVGQPRLVADDLDFPNGMAVTAGQRDPDRRRVVPAPVDGVHDRLGRRPRRASGLRRPARWTSTGRHQHRRRGCRVGRRRPESELFEDRRGRGAARGALRRSRSVRVHARRP